MIFLLIICSLILLINVKLAVNLIYNIIPSIYIFFFNKDFPNPNSILEINEWISKHKNAEITKFMGYCDSIDSKDYNKNLAERRINNVQLLLEKSGFKIKPTIERIAIGKDFKQSKIQAESRTQKSIKGSKLKWIVIKQLELQRVL